MAKVDAHTGGAMEGAPTFAKLTAARLVTAVCFVVLIVLAYARNVNWDEFFFLSHVHAHLAGVLDRPLQTFYVHGFGWLAHLPGGEMQQILAARLTMIGFLGVTVVSLQRIAREFTDGPSADIAVLAFVTSGFFLAHGGSFRADPMAAAFLTSSVAVLLTTRLSVLHILGAAVLCALAMLVTIKSVLYAPAYLGVLIWRWHDLRSVVRVLLSLGLAAGLFIALYSWHASGITPAGGNETVSNATDAASRTFLKSRLFPRSQEILSWVVFSAAQIGLVLLALGKVGFGRRALVVGLFAVPLFSVVLYRNAFAYFFPFATPLIMVAVAIGAQRLAGTRTLSRSVAIMVASAAIQLVLIAPEGNRVQRETLAEVHRLFERPVAYIDDSHMVASFHNPGFFMSSWGVARYRERGQAVFPDLIETHRPPLLVANKHTLQSTMRKADASGRETSPLLAEDREILRRSYVHYSGAIWLAGRDVVLGEAAAQVALPFPGRYRVESDTPGEINGKPVTDGTVIEAGDDPVTVRGATGRPMRLIWDTGVAPIARDALGNRPYFGFQSLLL